MPLRLRHGYAAGIHRGLPIGDMNRPRSSPHFVQIRTATQPVSVRFGAGGSLLRGVHTLIHCRYTFPSCSPTKEFSALRADTHRNPARIRQVWSWWFSLERRSYADSLSLHLPVLLAGRQVI